MSLLTVSGYFFRPRSLRPDGPRQAPVYAENVSGNRDLVAGGVQGGAGDGGDGLVSLWLRLM